MFEMNKNKKLRLWFEKWIWVNGGGLTSYVTEYTAMNGHLETLKWINYVDSGEWTSDMRRKLSTEQLVCKDIENTIIAYVLLPNIVYVS
jgi:hypothetical protein